MFQKDKKTGKTKIMNLVREVDLLIVLMILHDQFDFKKDDIKKMIKEYRDKLDSYDKKYFSYEDMRELIKDEIGVEV
ncbi:hypothetical protein [Anaerostipes sp. PC18]|uniref:hypothetical protein n=1 Tax=Anaerostipes sp. PC18 TaxID=3036926 RepID=UPI0030896226|nr:hypothetical protein P8F77_10315 [Anaerostipes sp. PC18]